MQRSMDLIRSLAVAAAVLAFGGAGMAQEAPKSINVGYVVSLSGPLSPGATSITAPNYRLWVDDVNKAGGLMLRKYGKRVPIKVVELDDTSSSDNLMRFTERLMAVDKVDFVLTPWGTGPNLAVAPIYAKYGYPQIMGTAGSDKIEALVQKFPTMIWMLAKPEDQAKALVDVMAGFKKEGKINDAVALFIVQAPFGQEYTQSLRPQLAAAGFKVAYEVIYPSPPNDLSTQIKAAKAANADSLIAMSYPPDTFMLTEQSLANDYKPKVRILGVGTAFPAYKAKFGDKIDGMLGLGGWDPAGPGMKEYFERHKAVNKGLEPDRWASSATYVGLQMLQQAIERVGEIDRAKILEELKKGSFETVTGPVALTGNRDASAWLVGQWQGGEFYGVAPKRPGARAPVFK